MTAATHPHALTEEQLADYRRDGVIVLRQVVPVAVIADLRDLFERTVDKLATRWHEEGFVADPHPDLPFETRFAALREQLPARFPTSWRKILLSPAVFGLWQLPQLVGPARSIVGDEVYAHGVWNGRPREPGNPIQKVLWHQDAHYYRDWDATDGGLISVWIPLVAVDEQSSCMQIAVGSHTKGRYERLRGYNGLFTVDDRDLEGFTVWTVDMEPGDALIFSDTTLHQSTLNESDHVRWSIDIRFGTAAPEIIGKTPRGYRCFSASDPASVESYETWVDRYDYDKVGLDAEIEDLETEIDPAEAARLLKTSRSELELF